MDDIGSTIKKIKQVRKEAQSLLRQQNKPTVPELEHMGARLYASSNALRYLNAIMLEQHASQSEYEDKLHLIEKIKESEMKLVALCNSIDDVIAVKERENRVIADEVFTGAQGRPKKNIKLDQLESMLQLGYSLATIAQLFGVSVATIKRRKDYFGLLSEREKTSITDAELDNHVDVAVCRQPLCGINMIQAELRRQGLWVPHNRVRESMMRLDEVLINANVRAGIHRRVYKVAAPNSLWHLDSNLKLTKKFGIVIHGAIDGYSRKILHLYAADNKLASTVQNCFMLAVREYGWPTRIRTDKGGEKARVVELMVRSRPAINNAHLVGSSVHNQRIERLWVDVRHCVTQLFIDLYEELVSCREYDKDNAIDMFCARKCFIPSLNRRLCTFTLQWSNHSLATEHQKTPNQLYVAGTLMNARSELPEANNILTRGDPADVELTYGVAGNVATVEFEDDDENIPVSSINLLHAHLI